MLPKGNGSSLLHQLLLSFLRKALPFPLYEPSRNLGWSASLEDAPSSDNVCHCFLELTHLVRVLGVFPTVHRVMSTIITILHSQNGRREGALPQRSAQIRNRNRSLQGRPSSNRWRIKPFDSFPGRLRYRLSCSVHIVLLILSFRHGWKLSCETGNFEMQRRRKEVQLAWFAEVRKSGVVQMGFNVRMYNGNRYHCRYEPRRGR